jgi:hypothetical protein
MGMARRRRRNEVWSPASVVRAVVGAVALACAVGAIVSVWANRFWGESLLSTVGSRHTPLWLAWFVTSVLFVIACAGLWFYLGYLISVIRGRIPRRPRAPRAPRRDR